MRIPKIDRFGNPYVNVACTDKKGRGWFKGHLEYKGKLLAIEVGEDVKTDDKTGLPLRWVRVTEREQGTRGGFGGNSPRRGSRGGFGG